MRTKKGISGYSNCIARIGDAIQLMKKIEEEYSKRSLDKSVFLEVTQSIQRSVGKSIRKLFSVSDEIHK